MDKNSHANTGRKAKTALTLIILSAWLANFIQADEVQRDRSEDDKQVSRSPLFISTSQEMGQMVKGRDPWEAVDISGEFVSRTGVWLTQKATINDPVGMNGGIEFIMGAGGLFWYSFPEEIGQAHTRGTKFGPGISQAQAIYKAGDITDPKTIIQFGLFPIKYNQDAVNLGEYLFRSGTYPGFLTTGSWNIINSAAYMGQGIRVHLSHFDHKITQDFTLFMERDYVPQFDFTPSYLVNADFDFLEFGAGVSFNHFLPVKPSLLKPKQASNAYVSLETFPEIPTQVTAGDTVQYFHPAGPQRGLEKEFENLQDANGNNPFKERYYTDTLTRTARTTRDDPLYLAAPGAFEETQEYRYKRSTSYYTFQGIKLMARVALDFKELFPSTHFTPHDLRFFAEVALLGVKDYPFYYENRLDRMPVMIGFNMPTYRFLDILSIQAEYYRSRFPNNLDNLWKQGLPIWTLDEPEYPNRYSPKDFQRDDWKWSVYGKRHITKGVDLFFQVATDHLRSLHYEGRFSYWPIAQNPTQWYYMTRLEFGI
jgi:hypothetical protein